MKKLKDPSKVYGLNFTAKEIEAAKKNNKLLTLDLETSHFCNLKCIYCYASSGKKLSNELSLKELKDVVKQAKALGVKNISIIGGGEPLLYKPILDLVKYIYESGIEQDIFTNGTFITEDIAKMLLKMKVQLVVKMNSLKPEVQDYLVGVKGTGKKIMTTLEMLQDIGYNKNNLLGVESIICKQNIQDMPEMWQWARDRHIIPNFEMITFQGRAKSHDLNVTIDDLQKLFFKFLLIDQEKYGYTWNPHPPIAALSCNRHYYNLVVSANGFVHPCVGVDIKLGNIRHQKLEEIIKSSPFLKAIRNMNKHVHGSCKLCKLNGECYGCRGMAYHLTGDCFASDPLCWFNEEKIKINKDGSLNN